MDEERSSRPDGGIGRRVDRSETASDALRPSEGRPSEGQPSEGQPPEGQPSEGQPPEADSTTAASEFVGEDLVIGYRSRAEPVIDGETLRVPPGEVTALVGPNGSGKSTLLKGLADQLGLDDGTVLLDGTDVHTLDTKELARKLGLLSQENVSPGGIVVEKLVEHGRYPHRGFFEGLSATDREAIDRAISLTGIEHLRDREVGSLSGGQKQLVWVAMVLAQETDVLLLDEPTTFLDLHHQLEVMDVVETLRDDSDVTVVVVLHDIDQAARYADHVVALKDGEIHARGPPEAVITEQLLAEVFQIDANVEQTERGPRIEPLRARHDDASNRDGEANDGSGTQANDGSGTQANDGSGTQANDGSGTQANDGSGTRGSDSD